MKTCSKCGLEKGAGEFYKRSAAKDGLQNDCKPCCSAYKKTPQAREGQKKHYLKYREEKIAKGKKWAEKNPEKCAEIKRNWAENNKGKAQQNKARWKKDNPIKVQAGGKALWEIKAGRLERESCTDCGSGTNVIGHHDDYAKPLDVRWLCAPCHRKWHTENGPGLNG